MNEFVCEGALVKRIDGAFVGHEQCGKRAAHLVIRQVYYGSNRAAVTKLASLCDNCLSLMKAKEKLYTCLTT